MAVCVVTGGAGFIGSRIVLELVRQGHAVRVLDNFFSGNKTWLKPLSKNVKIFKADVRNLGACRKIFKGASFIFHEAALVSVEYSMKHPLQIEEVNVAGCLNVLEAARIEKVRRCILASSCAVYGALTPYAISKLTLERYAKIYGESFELETVCLRYYNVYGPHQLAQNGYGAVVPSFFSYLAKNTSGIIRGGGKQTRDFVYVDDVVEANILAAFRPKAKGHVLDIGSGCEYSINQLYKMMAELTGKRHLKARYPKNSYCDRSRSVADIYKAHAVLGWKPRTSLRRGLERTWIWFGK